MLASAAFFVYLKIDQVMIGAMMGNYEVGIYAAGVKLVEVWYFIPGVICGSLFPAIVNDKKTGEEMYKKRLRNFYTLMVIIPVLMAAIIAPLSKSIIFFIFGDGYLESAGVLQIYIWSSLGLFLGQAVTQYLMSENLVKTIFWLNFLAMVVNVILNLVLISILGLSGAAWATLISYMIIPLYIFLQRKKV